MNVGIGAGQAQAVPTHPVSRLNRQRRLHITDTLYQVPIEYHSLLNVSTGRPLKLYGSSLDSIEGRVYVAKLWANSQSSCDEVSSSRPEFEGN